MPNYRFSGHESFHCRPYWLKKGFDFKTAGKNFPDLESPISLGVGKNMVSSIRHWLKSFGIMGQDEGLFEVGKSIFDNNGWDPYLEDEGTLWLLHFWLVTKGYASIYSLAFNELRKKRPIFGLNHFIGLVDEKNEEVSPNTLKTDFQAFTRTYVSKTNGKDLEENSSGILTDLSLVSETKSGLEIEPKARPEIPTHILAYCILEACPGQTSISFDILYNEIDNVGCVFALSQNGLNERLENLNDTFNWMTYSNEAGIRELQIKKLPKSNMKILEEYYGS